MKSINYQHAAIAVVKTRKRGRGMFATKKIPVHTIIETAPVIVMPAPDRKLIDGTLLHDYIFEWGDSRKECCMALGYVSLYNHAYDANCEYEMDFRRQLISVITIKPVKAGEELFINYNGERPKETPLWFDAK